MDGGGGAALGIAGAVDSGGYGSRCISELGMGIVIVGVVDIFFAC